MPHNHHKCDDNITKFIIELAQMLRYKKCNSKQLYTFPGSVLNSVFNTNYFNYTHSYRVCNYFMVSLNRRDNMKYKLLMSSLITKDNIDVITSPPNQLIPTSKCSMRDIFFSKLSDVMKSILN